MPNNILEEHRRLLADSIRLSAFREAIERVVKKNDVVVDLGSGSGIFGLMACKAGAARVYSIEKGEMLLLARKIATANHFEDRIVFLQELSTRAQIPEKADVIVGDQTGQFGWEAGILNYFADASARFLKPDGKMIPSHLELYIALVEAEKFWKERIQIWSSSFTGFDLNILHDVASNTAYSWDFTPNNIVSQPALVGSFNLSDSSADTFRFSVELSTNRETTIHGIAGWFCAHLCPRIQITNSPLEEITIRRSQGFYPLSRPILAQKNSRIAVSFEITPSQQIVEWSIHEENQHEQHSTQRIQTFLR